MTQTPITLTLEGVKAAALKAYKEKRLSAQSDDPVCRYRNPAGCPCAIGAAIPDDLYEEKFEGVNVETLVTNWLEIRLDDHNSIGELTNIQDLHDDWAIARKAALDEELGTDHRRIADQVANEWERKFLEAIQ